MSNRHRQPVPESVIPQRKISETIIDFGAPVLHDLRPDTPIEVVRASFNIAISVWNAHVMAMPVWNAPHLLAHLQTLLRTPVAAPEMVQAYRDLTARRQELFATDPRAVGEWNVSMDQNGNVNLRCDARVPPSLMPRER
jgi:hypothetical protein